MPISAKDTFDHAIARSNHFLTLYELLHDTRQRDARMDWIRNFNDCMHWPRNERVVRVDGKDKKSLLILREELKISRTQFNHDYLSELLRSALASSISALDRYMHDLVVERCWALLTGPEDEVPSELKKINIPVLAAKRAVAKVKKDRKARPGSLLKQEIQKVLHRNSTFQNANSITKASKMIGIKNFWSNVAHRMPGAPKVGDLQAELDSLCRRRNQIVHESDLILKTSARQITARPITFDEANDAVTKVSKLVDAIHAIT